METASPVGPSAGVLGTAIRMVPFATSPPGPLGSAVVPVSLGPRAMGWDCCVVVLVLSSLGLPPPFSVGARPAGPSLTDIVEDPCWAVCLLTLGAVGMRGVSSRALYALASTLGETRRALPQ
jgi:hypothetical protein